MNKQPILLVGFSRYTDQGLLVKTNFIVSSMTGNALYPDAGTKLTNVSDALSGFSDALDNKGKVLNYASVKQEKRLELMNTLKTLGFYVRDKYPGNVANWLSAGFDVQTFDTPTQLPETPINLKAKDGPQIEQTVLSFKAMRYAVSYDGRCWMKGEEPPVNAQVNTTDSRKMLFTEIKPLTEYNYQVRSRGTKGTSPWSQAVSWVVR